MTKRKNTKKKNDDYAARQLRQIKQRGHLRRSTLMALLVLALAGGALSQIGRAEKMAHAASEKFIAWSATQGFTVQQVDVTGRTRVDATFVAKALQIERGQPLLAYDVKAAQERLSQNPWFKSVQVERRLPQTIFVTLTERTPAARWQMNGKLVLVDASGTILTTDNLEPYKNLPVIVGQEARHKIMDLFSLLMGEPDIARDVVAATWIGNRRWDLRMISGITVKLPADDPGLALAQLAALHEKDQILSRDITTVDLRLPDKAVLSPTARANTLIERPDFSDTPDTAKKSI